MKQYAILAQVPNKPMPWVFHILARDEAEARRLWYLNHPGWFVYEIREA